MVIVFYEANDSVKAQNKIELYNNANANINIFNIDSDHIFHLFNHDYYKSNQEIVKFVVI